ncbi:MAG: ABC transporter permease [Pseudomonadota bacterium]
MLGFFGRRLLSSVGLLFVVSVLSFILIQAPEGDFASYYKSFAISQGGMTEEGAEQLADQIRKRYGLDKPLVDQYFGWVGGILTRGDFGHSFIYNKPVGELINERFWRTLGIAFTCHLLATVIGVSLGIYAAVNQHKIGDTASTVLAFLGMTIPRFFMALLILYWLAFVVGSPYIGSLNSPHYVLAPWSFAKLWDLLLHIWPIIVIAAIGGLAYNLRVMRGNLLDVLRQPFVETARAKGLPERKVIMKHAVPNALHPLVMYQGVILPYMLTGELEVAIILSVPTIGPLMLDTLVRQDVYVTATIFLLLSCVLIIGNLIADLMLAALDPRVRTGGRA